MEKSGNNDPFEEITLSNFEDALPQFSLINESDSEETDIH